MTTPQPPARYSDLAAAQVTGKTVAALTWDPAMGNWAMTFTDGTHITFGSVVDERYLPDGQDMRDTR
jgi:hypothetical protein